MLPAASFTGSPTISKHRSTALIAHCCRETRVSVSRADIEALALHLDMPPAEIIKEYTLPDPQDRETVLRQTGNGCVFLHGIWGRTGLVVEPGPFLIPPFHAAFNHQCCIMVETAEMAKD
jgi:hypothetical protein